jgi:FixJ family two-component response regulator
MTKPRLYVAIVDDDKSLSRSLGRFLRVSGIEPITYGSAEEFLADDKHPDFGCLVLDIQLGGMSGLVLAQELIARGNIVPFIFVTAHDDAESRATAHALGCGAYLLKSIPGAELLKTIHRVAAQ